MGDVTIADTFSTISNGGKTWAQLGMSPVAGQVIVLRATSAQSSAVIPTIDGSYTPIGAGGGVASNCKARGAYRVLDGSETGIPTFTNATRVYGYLLDGVDVADVVGAFSGDTSTSNTMNYPALTMEVTDGTSTVLLFGDSTTGSGNLPNPSDCVLGISFDSGRSEAYYKDNATSWSQQQPSPQGSSWVTLVVEIRANPISQVNKDLELIWDVDGTIHKDLVLSWDVEEGVGRSLVLSWDVAKFVGRSLPLSWNVEEDLGQQYPDKILLIDWDRDGFGDDIDDRTADFKRITWSRGADKAGPGRIGTATITVNDFDGTYVDTNEDSDLFGKLRPGVPVWVTADFEGIPRGLFAGYIDEIVPKPHEYEAEITCSDLFRRAGEVTLYPPDSLATVHDARVWVLEQLGVDPAGWQLSASEGQTLHRAPEFKSALAILEDLNNAVGSTHVMVPGNTENTWQNYVVIDRHAGIKDVVTDVTVDGTEHVKENGFGGWRTTYDTVENRVTVTGTPPPGDFEDEEEVVWQNSHTMFITGGTTRRIIAKLDGPVTDVRFELFFTSVSGPVSAGIEQIGWDSVIFTFTADDPDEDVVIAKARLWARKGLEPSGITFDVDNDASQDEFGIKEADDIDSSLVGDAIANGAAEHVVFVGGAPRKVPTVTLMDDFAEILDGEVGSLTSVSLARIFVDNRRMRIVGIDGDAGNGVVWSVAWQMIDEQEAEPDLFTLDVDSLDTGVLGR